MRNHFSLFSRTGLILVSMISLLGNANAGVFAPAVNYSAGTNPGFVAVADFNEDGFADLAVTNSNLFGGGDSNVSILLGQGDGTFRSGGEYTAARSPRAVAVGDFNHDRHIDLAVTNETSGNLSILLGNGDGTFQSPVNYPAGRRPFFVTAADLNADGVLDLVVTNLLDTGRISVMLGNGDGTFQPPAIHLVAPNVRPHMVAIADINHDGKPDLVVASAGVGPKPGGVSVLMGKGDGDFRAPLQVEAGGNPFGVAVADFNGDHQLDLAVADETDSTLTILPGLGKGKFGQPVTYATGTLPFCVVAVDVDGDGNLDLVTANENSNDVTVLLGNGRGSFASAISFPVDQAPQGLAVGNFDANASPDLAVPNLISNDVSILINTGAAR